MNILINFFASLYDLTILVFASLYDLVYNSISFFRDYLKWITNIRSAKSNNTNTHTDKPAQVHKQKSLEVQENLNSKTAMHWQGR